jgi:hypothetical protein
LPPRHPSGDGLRQVLLPASLISSRGGACHEWHLSRRADGSLSGAFYQPRGSPGDSVARRWSCVTVCRSGGLTHGTAQESAKSSRILRHPQRFSALDRRTSATNVGCVTLDSTKNVRRSSSDAGACK